MTENKALAEHVEDRIKQIFLDIAEGLGADSFYAKEEIDELSATLFSASDALVQRWRQFLQELPE